MISRRAFTVGVGAGFLPLGALHAQEVAWPTKPVRVIVPNVAGGILDLLTREVTSALSEKLGQPFVVENRPGASANIGLGAGARAAPDGYTLVAASDGPMVTHELLFKDLQYSASRDFVIASIFWQNTNFLFVADKHPAKTVAEFIEWTKKSPQPVLFGSAGIGTPPHLAAELFKIRTGIEARHVPFRGSPQTAMAIMSGDVSFSVDNIGVYRPFLQSGQIRGLAVTSEKRWPTEPNVPTMAEAGVKDMVVMTWSCFAFPSATPSSIVSKLSASVASIVAEPSIVSRFLDIGAEAMSTTPEEAKAIAAAERKLWTDIFKTARIKLE